MVNRIKLAAFCLFSGWVCFSCKTPDGKTAAKSFHLELVDSVLVDFQGDLHLADYDPQEQKYLLTDDANFSYLEIDGQGNILNQGRLNTDGPDAIDMVLGMGYYQSKVTVATPSDGFKVTGQGKVVGEVKIPYSYAAYNFLPFLGLYDWEGGKLYVRFSADSLMTADPSHYLSFYKLPVLEFQKEGDPPKNILTLPEGSSLRDGQYHGLFIPVFKPVGDKVYFLNWFNPEIYLYKKSGSDLEFAKQVKLDLPGWVSYDPVPLSNADAFYDAFGKKMPGSIMGIWPMGDLILINYSAGIGEEKFLALDMKDPSFSEKRAQLNKPKLAVLDQELNILAKDLSLPEAASDFMTVSSNRELIVGKNPLLSKSEDEGLVLYRLILKER